MTNYYIYNVCSLIIRQETIKAMQKWQGYSSLKLLQLIKIIFHSNKIDLNTKLNKTLEMLAYQ